MTTYRLPFPPSVNRIWRAVGGRIVLSAAARAWLKLAANAMPPGRVPPPLTGRLRVTITLHAPRTLRNKAWDCANREKILCDFLTKQRVWLDDSQIDELYIIRCEPDPAGAGFAVIHIVEVSK
ncbi:RusA family crossover junction endodeoxyribonuclease [Klebsiella aerogenes]|uniref:RusA family crossover junction endodeoxyribonuclease n=2 Tax=Gammaproteobacteria TaxID=1236 RepID=UPI0037A66B59